jgi:lipopolysaccharide/colanic/teichoic acid biosynthesis glycosyltransferase
MRNLPRIADVLLAATGLLVAMPLLAAAALAIRLATRGPVWFAQERLGRGGRPFVLHKLRTLADDGAPTRIGGWLRRTRLDELPQLWDVLRGRMALVGPRPETAVNLAAVAPADRQRLLAVRPGLTGPTQLEFLGEDDALAGCADRLRVYREILVPEKVRRDLRWFGQRSCGGDLRVLACTPFAVLSRRVRARSRRLVEALLERGG